MNLQDAWTIDQHIDFDCHHKQLNFSWSVSIQPPLPTHTHNKCTQAYWNWMQGQQRRVSQQLWVFFFTAGNILLSKNQNSTSTAWKHAPPHPTTPVSDWTHERELSLTWSRPNMDFIVQKNLYSCFDMPLSSTSAPWPAARHRQQGYNPSVEPSWSHRALSHWGLVVRDVSLQPWLFSCISFGRSVSEMLLNPKLEGLKVGEKGQERDIEHSQK